MHLDESQSRVHITLFWVSYIRRESSASTTVPISPPHREYLLLITGYPHSMALHARACSTADPRCHTHNSQGSAASWCLRDFSGRKEYRGISPPIVAWKNATGIEEQRRLNDTIVQRHLSTTVPRVELWPDGGWLTGR